MVKLLLNLSAAGRMCSSGQFSCTNGACIPGEYRCDRLPDCSDGADERDCRKFPSVAYLPSSLRLLWHFNQFVRLRGLLTDRMATICFLLSEVDCRFLGGLVKLKLAAIIVQTC